MNETQCCYVCGKYFDDKVKLGLHLTPCYNEAVGIRKELWHPHPLDLVDEQRYTEYMKGRMQHREQYIREAERQGISFVTADTFEAMRGTLGPVRSARPASRESRQAQARPSMSPQVVRGQPQVGLPLSPPHSQPSHNTSHQAQVAQPVRVVATGVTMLRNELADEIHKLRELREMEEAEAANRNQQFTQLLQQFQAVKGSGEPHRSSESCALPQVTQALQKPPPLSGPSPPVCSNAQPFPHHTACASPGAAEGAEMSDGRIRCGTCGKLFGKKGFQVHAQRCFRGADDFTFSKDARFERNHPTPNQPVPQLQDVRYADAPTAQPPSGDWTQFMTTYPRPVLDEKPKTAKERNQAAIDAKKKAEYQQMVQREMSGAPPPAQEPREATVPCGRCGRFFYTSRVAKHEATCVSKPKKDPTEKV